MKHILYHENNLEKPYKPQEDSFAHNSDLGIYIVSDGVSHDLDPIEYPNPSDAYEVSRIVSNYVLEYLSKSDFSLESIKSAYINANKKVQDFNVDRPLYRNRKNNGYTIGATTSATIWIKESRLLYGVLDDCFISIFGKDLSDHPTLKSYVEHSAKYLDSNFDWKDLETRRIWREEIRNHKVTHSGIEYGYGVIDGREGFEQYLQLGEVEISEGDLVCVYSDGFIKPLQNMEFIKNMKDINFSNDTFKYIAEFMSKNLYLKEKTIYFIK